MSKIDLLTVLVSIIVNNTKWLHTDIISFSAYFRTHEFLCEHDFLQIRNCVILRNPDKIHLDSDEGLFLEIIFGTAPRLGKKSVMFTKNRHNKKWEYQTFVEELNEIENRLRNSDVDYKRCTIK